MNVSDIKLLYNYNFWADHRILNAAAHVTPEQYTAPAAYKTLRALLVHTLDSLYGWRQGFQTVFVPANRIGGGGPAPQWNAAELTEDDLPTFDTLRARWDVEERETHDYLDSLTDSDLNGVLRYAVPGGIVRERVLWHCLVHVVNHGTQHRSEAAVILTNYGYSPGELDVTAFLNEYFNLEWEE